MTNFIKQSALVLILAVVFGSGLAVIYAWTNPLYLINQEKATLESIAKTIPGADKAENLQTSEVKGIEGYKVYRVVGYSPEPEAPLCPTTSATRAASSSGSTGFVK